MALYSLTFTHTPGSFGTLIEYRKSTETTWTTPTSSPNPTVLNAYLLDLEEGFTYYVRLSAYGGKCIKTYKIITVQTGGSYIWVEDEYYCEETTPLTLVDTITGFADPIKIAYDNVSGRMYVVDVSAVTTGSNIYWFNPNTITAESDAVPVGSLNVAALAAVMDMDNRKIYITGANTSGMIRYDIASNTVTNLNYGSNGLHNKNSLASFGDSIVSPDSIAATLYTINKSTYTVSNSITYSSIPSYTQYFSNGNIILRVNNEWWVLASQGANLGANGSGIARYNDTFTSLIGIINLPGQVTWTNSAYWRSVLLESNRLLVFDCGSSKLMSVNLSTLSVTTLYTFTNRQGKVASAFAITKDPVSGEYYAAGAFSNNANTDFSPIYIAYKLNTVTLQPDYIYPSLVLGEIVRQGTTTKLFSVNPGVISYPSNPVGSTTDGTVGIFDKTGGGDYTGNKIVTTLKLVEVGTLDPTGETKVNMIGTEGYIPPYVDEDECPVVYDLSCPIATSTQTGSTAEYEYSLKASTANNPALDHIVLEQVDTVTSTVVASTSVAKNTYQHGTLVRVGSNPNQVNLLFKNSSNVTIGTCSNIFTIT